MTTKKTEDAELDFSCFNVTLDETAECPVLKVKYPDDSFPVLIVKFADMSENEQLKAWVRKKQMGDKSKIATTPEEQEEKFNEILKEAFAHCVVVDWKNVILANGKEAPFSKQNCHNFLKQIHNVQWKEIRKFCTNSANFGDVAEIDAKIKN